MQLNSMKKIPDEDQGTEFHSVIYWARHSNEFKLWAEENCQGEWGCEEQSFRSHFIGDITLFSGWLYSDRDAMLFKLTFA